METDSVMSHLNVDKSIGLRGSLEFHSTKNGSLIVPDPLYLWLRTKSVTRDWGVISFQCGV